MRESIKRLYETSTEFGIQAERASEAFTAFGEAVKDCKVIAVRPKIKVSYRGRTYRFGTTLISIGVTFTDTAAHGIMYVRPDALPHKYGME